jgi:hypothetical protein
MKNGSRSFLPLTRQIEDHTFEVEFLDPGAFRLLTSHLVRKRGKSWTAEDDLAGQRNEER